MKDKERHTLRSDSLLMTTALIWGFAFVAQRVGMKFVGPFGFNGVRFALGCLVLLPFILKNNRDAALQENRGIRNTFASGLKGGILAGAVLFAGASFQQIGMIYTCAGNAGFITGLYVVLVPILGMAIGQKTNAGTWIGAFLAAAGLYLLSVTDRFTIAFGDLLILIGALFWACHVHIIGRFSPGNDSLKLSFIQYATCSVLSLITGLAFERFSMDSYSMAAIPILYGGIMSVGVAYTLQVVAQKHARPSHAAILLSLEAVFAALGGWLILGEVLSPRAMAGCALMFCGMLISQLWRIGKR